MIKANVDDLLRIDLLQLNYLKFDTIKPSARFLFRNIDQIVLNVNKDSEFTLDELQCLIKQLVECQSSRQKQVNVQLTMPLSKTDLCDQNKTLFLDNLFHEFRGINVTKLNAFSCQDGESEDEFPSRVSKIDQENLNEMRSNKQVTTLYLSNFDVSNVESKSLNRFSNLIELSLHYSKRLSLHVNAFQSLGNLETLELSFNNIEKIEAGVFDSLLKVKKLCLSSNKLTHIDRNLFAKLRSLTKLVLSDNLIEHIEPGTFDSLLNLQELFLTYNNLGELKADVFNNLTQMKRLYLNRNEIVCIENGAFDSLAKLEKLHLSCNKLSAIWPRIFRKLYHLTELDLGQNAIECIESGTFDDLIKLRELRLEANRIAQIQPNLFVKLARLIFLDLGKNPIMEGFHKNTFRGLFSLETLFLIDVPVAQKLDSTSEIFTRHLVNIQNIEISLYDF